MQEDALWALKVTANFIQAGNDVLVTMSCFEISLSLSQVNRRHKKLK